MSPSRIAVYAGSFDPPTKGHLWIIKKGLELFDKLIVAIGTNPQKNYTFSVEERIELIKASTEDTDRLEVEHFDNRYLVDYAREQDALFVIRGIRSSSDYDYERVMRHINADLAKEITTIFLMPPRDISEVSSSMVMGLVGPKGWEKNVERYVPKKVLEAMHDKLLDANDFFQAVSNDD